MATFLLLFLLFLLIALSGFFSGSETSLMAVNRYRLQHLARKDHAAAQRLMTMLSRPDRILSVILIGNTFANVLASAITTMIAVHLFGEVGVVLATIFLTLTILIFAEIMPKTVAALFSERVAFFVSMPLNILLKALYPLVWLINGVANKLLFFVGIKVKGTSVESLSRGELRTLLLKSGEKISSSHQGMLLGILDLEQVTVNDIMVPCHEIVGVDINDEWEKIVDTMAKTEYIRLLVYDGSIDKVCGFIHARKALNLFTSGKSDKKALLHSLDEVRYVPEGTLLSMQLLNFQREKYRIGLVVDEYGDIQGLVTLSDILEEIVGEFCTDLVSSAKELRARSDGAYIVDGDIPIRDLNRTTGWHFPADGPNTLSGLIIEHLETIPNVSVGLRIAGYPIEVLRVSDNKIIKAKVLPSLYKAPKQDEA